MTIAHSKRTHLGYRFSFIALALAGLYPHAGPANAQSEKVAIEEVLVTAQRRSQRLVDVPISVSTASGDDLERAGATTIENLTKVVPGVYIQRAVYGMSPTVRGIGSTLAASGGEQNVAMYVDEIYYPTPTGNIFDLASVSSIEVLKGPQGTLFGRNATGGALLLRTFDPNTDELSGRLKASYERYDQVRTSAYINVPVTDKVAFNGAIAYRDSKGYVKDALTGQRTNESDNFTWRVKGLLEPLDNLSVVLTASHAELNDPTGGDGRNFEPATLLVLLGGGAPISTDRFDSTFGVDQFIKTETDELSARVRLELDMGTFSSFTASLQNKLDALSDLTYTYIPQDVYLLVESEMFSQEFNFVSPQDQPLSYVAGVYIYKGKSAVPIITQNGVPLFFTDGKRDSVAGYVDGTYDFGKLSLIAGVRYSWEKGETDSGFGVNQPALPTRFQKATDKMWTPRVGLQYALNDEANVYATYSKGFKSGTFDATTANGPGVDPETVNAFEVGFKSASEDYTFNAAAYFYDYVDTQVNATVSGAEGQIFNQLSNVPKSRIYGAEVDGSLRLGDNFDLRAAVAYTHARYEDFPFAPGYVLDPADPATLGGLLYSNISLDASGNTMVRSPEFTASSTLSYHTMLGDNKGLEITVSPYYSSRVYFNFENSASQGQYLTLDAGATLTWNENVTISLFGRNLTDSDYRLNKAQNALSLSAQKYSEPRTYGVSIGYAF